MSPLQTSLFAFVHGGRVTIIEKFDVSWHTPPQCQIHLAYTSSKWHGTAKHYTSQKSKNKIRITSSFMSYIWTHHVKLILIKGALTILSITVLYYKQVITILPIAVCILGVILHSPPFFFSEHILLLGLLGGYCLVVVNSSSCGCHCFWCYEGIEPPLYGWQGSPLPMGGSIPYQGVDVCSSLFLTQRGTYQLHPLCFGVANHDPIPWVVMLVSRSTIQWHLSAALSFPQPNAHVPLWHQQPCCVTCGLHLSSMDAPVGSPQ